MSKKDAKFHLGERDAAIVFRMDGSREVLIPNRDPEESIEDDAPEFLAMLCILMLDHSELRQQVMELLSKEMNFDSTVQ